MRAGWPRWVRSRRFLLWYYCLLLAAVMLGGSWAFSWYRSAHSPAPGTLVVLVAGAAPSDLRARSVDIEGGGAWRSLAQNVSARVPSAPDTSTIAQATVSPGVYDALRFGSQVVRGPIQVAPGQVTPVLVAVEAGRPVPDGVYAGSEGVNLALQELGGRLHQVPAFDLLDQDGRPFTNATIAGHDVVLAAFHTTCATTCPLYTGLFMQLAGKLPPSTLLVEATTDPQTDTPQVLRAYAEKVGVHWTLVTGSVDQMEAFWKPFGVQLSGAQLHSSTLALIDAHGYVRTFYQGVPDLNGTLAPVLSSQLNGLGQEELRGHGDGWGAPQVLDALRTIGATARLSTLGRGTAPAFEAPGLTGGQVGLADHLGRPLVINFWASWCQPCKRELPTLQRTLAQHPGVGLLLVDERDSQGAARQMASQLGLEAPIAYDPDGKVGQLYQVAGLPTTVFVRPDGSIEGRYPGELVPSALQDHLAAINP
jgi:cytochrome c biogenesis protein CcmG/thiol:disulfide interchange protein DsbE